MEKIKDKNAIPKGAPRADMWIAPSQMDPPQYPVVKPGEPLPYGERPPEDTVGGGGEDTVGGGGEETTRGTQGATKPPPPNPMPAPPSGPGRPPIRRP